MLSSFMYCSVDEEQNENKSFLLCSGIYPGLDQRCLGIQKKSLFCYCLENGFYCSRIRKPFWRQNTTIEYKTGTKQGHNKCIIKTK